MRSIERRSSARLANAFGLDVSALTSTSTRSRQPRPVPIVVRRSTRFAWTLITVEVRSQRTFHALSTSENPLIKSRPRWTSANSSVLTATGFVLAIMLSGAVPPPLNREELRPTGTTSTGGRVRSFTGPLVARGTGTPHPDLSGRVYFRHSCICGEGVSNPLLRDGDPVL